MITLENEVLRLEFAPATGALTGLLVKQTGWSVLDRPHLGRSFKLLVPDGRRQNNPVDGETQKLTASCVAADGLSVRLVWDGVSSRHSGPLDIRVELEVRLEARRAVWTMSLLNRSRLVIEAAYVPYLGDLRHPADARWLRITSASYSGSCEISIWPNFTNLQGGYGVDHPMLLPVWPTAGTPMSPFYLVHDQNQGLYFGIAEASWDFSVWHAELRPGYARSIDARAPATDHLSQHEVHTPCGMIHLPYIQPGETRRLTPMAIEPFQGDWHAGSDIYLRSAVRPQSPTPPSWVREPHSWLQIHLNSPAGEARTRYADLVPLAREMAQHGITGMQITGWNMGGQDQNNPSHDTDPLLGTWEEFRDAIATIRSIGIKVILFAKFTYADRATQAFRETYRRLAVTDPFGDYQMFDGYRYQTPMQLLDINTKRLIPMCFLSEEYLQVCEREFQKILDLGADGFLFDECVHHGLMPKLCFSQHHGHRPGAPLFANDVHIVERFRSLSRPRNPDFCFAGEALYDWEYGAYHLCYFRTEKLDHVPWHRYLRPEAAILTAVTGFDDREMIAQCLLYKYIISYEPFNFKGRPGDYPLTLDYGKKMDALRRELRRWFWDGVCRDTLGATVTGADGKPHHPYTVFTPSDGGSPGVAIANYDLEKTASVVLSLPNGTTGYRYRLIDNTTWLPASGKIDIPPRGAAVVLPEH